MKAYSYLSLKAPYYLYERLVGWLVGFREREARKLWAWDGAISGGEEEKV